MITEITIENFKAFGRPQTIPIKPITLLYGPNSSGKSSIIQLLLMLKQTLECTSDDTLVTKGSLIELGDYKNIIHKHNLNSKLGISFKSGRSGHKCNLDDIERYLSCMDLVYVTPPFSIKCHFRSELNTPEIDSIQYFMPEEEIPLIQFNNSEKLKSQIAGTDRLGKESRIERDIIFNLFNFINEDHPLLEVLYSYLKERINLILIPIKGNLLRIFGNELKLSEFEQMTFDKFIARIKKRIKNCNSIEFKARFSENLKSFYRNEVKVLIDNYMRYSKYSYNSFLLDVKNSAGRAGYITINKFLFQMKFDETAFFEMIGENPFGERLLCEKNEIYVKKASPATPFYSKHLNALIDDIDPLGLFCCDPFAYNWLIEDPDELDEYLEYGIVPSGDEYEKLKLMANKLMKTSMLFSNGLDLNRLTPKGVRFWYKRWGHLGSEEYCPKDPNFSADFSNYRFSKYYKSASDYFSFINKKHIRVNLRNWIKGINRELESYLTSIEHIAPIRALPERFYFNYENDERSIMGKGESAPQRIFNSKAVESELNSVFNMIGIDYQLKVNRAGVKTSSGTPFSIELFDKKINTKVNLKDIGQGITQLIPIIIAGIAPSCKTILIEQPEIHIHPRLQAELGTFISECINNKFIRSDKKNSLNLSMKRFIIETHSEALMLRFQKLIRNKVLTPNDIAVIYVEKDGGEAKCKELRLDENGDFIDAWPGGFFEEGFKEMFE